MFRDVVVGDWEPLSSPQARKLPKTAEFVLGVNRGENAYGPLDEEFHLQRVAGHKWRLWVVFENQGYGRIETWPVAELSSREIDARTAAEELLVAFVAARGEAYWSSGEPDATVEREGLLFAADWVRVTVRAMKECGECR